MLKMTIAQMFSFLKSFLLRCCLGEKNGYNIPAVTRCPEALEWLSKDPREIIAAKEKGEIPEKVRRLLGDGYLCMYQNLDMTMYK